MNNKNNKRKDILLKIAKKDKDTYILDLSALNCTKILGAGIITKKLKLKAEYCSELAAEKIKKAGGAVELPAKKAAEPEEKQKKG